VSPTFVSDTVCAALVDPIGWLLNDRVAGVNWPTGPVVPCPFRPTAYKPPAALPVNVRVPPPEPNTVGLNFMLNAQLAPAASEAPQVVVCEKGPEIASPEIFSGPFPVFFKVTGWTVVVPPTTSLPKFKVFGVSNTPAVCTPFPLKL
jgi:hypothetical protein